MSANETFYETFSMDLPDIQGFIQKLDLMDENINKAVRVGMHRGANIICKEQRRLAPYNLSRYISQSDIYVTEKGVLGVAIGYMIEDDDINVFAVGNMFEFGRPGKSSDTRKNKYRWYSRRSKKRAEKGQPELEVFKGLKGTIQPIPHIRRGFHNAAPQACQAVIDAIQNEIDKIGDN